MCSFLLTNKKDFDINYVNEYLKYRGPDNTTIIKEKQWTFIHNLLSITGEFTTQPLIKDDVFLIFNGEIYNFLDLNKNYKSDGFYILDQYLNKKEDFFKFLDGEFALCLLDFKQNKLYFSGDLFLTKPIFFGIDNSTKEIGLASYKSALERLKFEKVLRLNPNTSYILDLNNFKLSQKTIYNWNLNQNIDTYEIWTESFFNAIKKRTLFTKNKFLVPMSSGYDSGAIVCALQQLNKNNDFITYSFYGNEDYNIINERVKILSNKIVKSSITNNEQFLITKEFNSTVEPFFYGPNPSTKTHDGFKDKGAIGLFYLLTEIKQKYNIKVQFSGQGGDEITGNLSTYGFNGHNPNVWPDNLSTVFPWHNFYYGANWSYLNKEECIAGSLGIETRYPLLDKQVVQSFLNLTPKLKNKNYKAPITFLFEKYNFPFKNEKLGFNLKIE